MDGIPENLGPTVVKDFERFLYYRRRSDATDSQIAELLEHGSFGVEAIAVLKVVLEPGVEHIEELEDLAGRLGLEPEGETVEEMRESLAESWRVVERAG